MFSPDKIYQYNFPTVIRFGVGVIQELAPNLKSENIKTPLVVTDPVVAGLDFFQTDNRNPEKPGIKA